MIATEDSQNTNSPLPVNTLPAAGAAQRLLSAMLIEG
jgi:hypothetical protein